ncbi:hypothetical protein D7X33_21115, partial [Butyricicoccus sp. 1XD8-22]
TAPALNASSYRGGGFPFLFFVGIFYVPFLSILQRFFLSVKSGMGAVFDAITTRDFESESIMQLSDADAMAFLDVAEPMYQNILSNSIENLRLATLRDALLPKPMSGEIAVSNVQL